MSLNRECPVVPMVAKYFWILTHLMKTRLKCKSSARVKIVLKKDWIVKKCWKKCKKK